MTFRKKLIEIAQKEIGTAEPSGDDKYITVYNSLTGMNFAMNVAWCAIFVTWCKYKAGIDKTVIPHFASCDIGMNWFKKNSLFKKAQGYGGNYVPQEGDIIFFSGKYSEADSTHVGIVEKVAGSIVYTVEGNTSDAVHERQYDLSNKYILGYGVPDYPDDVQKVVPSVNDLEKVIWDFLLGWIGNKFGVAGLIGNLQAESGLKSTNLQNSFEKKLGLNDDTYTAGVDNGSYTNFVKDSAGYGLAQWTYWSRKQNMLDFAKAQGASIGDLNMQLNFLKKEITASYGTVLKALKDAKSVKEASDVVLIVYEKPAKQDDSVKSSRASMGQKFFDKYAGSTKVPEVVPAPSGDTYTVQKGDSLWGIAQKFLGDGKRFKEIMSYNALTSTTIHAGLVLKIPRESTNNIIVKYTVRKGDSLWKIAEKNLRDGSRYREIMKLSGITSTTIHVGQVLILPSA